MIGDKTLGRPTLRGIALSPYRPSATYHTPLFLSSLLSLPLFSLTLSFFTTTRPLQSDTQLLLSFSLAAALHRPPA